MTLETALLSALSAVTTALCWAVKILYARLVKAEETVEALRLAHEELQRMHGEAEGKVGMYERCPRKHECPFFGAGAVGLLVALCVLLAGCDEQSSSSPVVTPQSHPECFFYRRDADSGRVEYHQHSAPSPPPPDVYSIGGSPGGG